MSETNSSQQNVYDVIIIGGGPAGVTAALYTARANLKTLIIDKSMKAGALGITSKIANYPGIPEVISGEELLQRMWKQAKLYGTQFKKAKAISADVAGETKTISTSEGESYSTRALILASGAMGRTNKVPGEDEFLGRGVSYCATCDGAFFKGKEVAVVGSNEEALEEALFLTRFVKMLYFITPKPKLEAARQLVEELRTKQQVQFLFGKRVLSVHGDGAVSHVLLSSDGKEEKLFVTGVFIYTQGSKPIVDYVSGQVDTSSEGCVVVNQEMATPIPGVFACGDILCNDVQQAVVAAAQGCIAALAADKYLNKRKAVAKDYR